MGQICTVIHCNPNLAHQVELADCLSHGLKKHDINATISGNPNAPADLHVVMGPWFALKQWRHSNTLYIDRAFWGDPECVTIHWLKGGEKVYLSDMPRRDHPELMPMKTGHRRIYLCDYGCAPLGEYDTVRWHPAERKGQCTLDQSLKGHQIAIGRRTTALVTAAIQGLKTETTDPHSPVWALRETPREQWINDIAWHNWSKSDIANGAFFDGIGHHG